MLLDPSTPFGIAFLVLVPLGFLVTFLLEPTSDVWVNNRSLFSGAWFLYNFYGRHIVETVLSRHSVLFAGMPPAIKRQDAIFIVFSVSFSLFCLPAGAITCVRVFHLGPVDFVPRFAGVTRCLISMGIAGEFVDLLTRHRLSIDIMVHHSIEIIGGGIMVDSAIRSFEPGFVFLVMMTAVGRVPKICLNFDHVRREGTSDSVFPEWCLSKEGTRNIFRACGSVTFFSSILQPIFYVSSYMIVHYGQISQFNRIWLPCMAAAFMVADIPYFRFIWKKSQ